MGPMDFMFGQASPAGTVAGPDYVNVMQYLTSPAQQMGQDQRRALGGMPAGPSMHDPNPSPMAPVGSPFLEALAKLGIFGGRGGL